MQVAEMSHEGWCMRIDKTWRGKTSFFQLFPSFRFRLVFSSLFSSSCQTGFVTPTLSRRLLFSALNFEMSSRYKRHKKGIKYNIKNKNLNLRQKILSSSSSLFEHGKNIFNSRDIRYLKLSPRVRKTSNKTFAFSLWSSFPS